MNGITIDVFLDPKPEIGPRLVERFPLNSQLVKALARYGFLDDPRLSGTLLGIRGMKWATGGVVIYLTSATPGPDGQYRHVIVQIPCGHSILETAVAL